MFGFGSGGQEGGNFGFGQSSGGESMIKIIQKYRDTDAIAEAAQQNVDDALEIPISIDDNR